MYGCQEAPKSNTRHVPNFLTYVCFMLWKTIMTFISPKIKDFGG